MTQVVLIVRKGKAHRLVKRLLRLDLLIAARRLGTRSTESRFRKNDANTTTLRGQEENDRGLHERSVKAERTSDDEALVAITKTLSRIRRVEISFNCAACGRRMSELRESGFCVSCDEALQSFPKRRGEDVKPQSST